MQPDVFAAGGYFFFRREVNHRTFCGREKHTEIQVRMIGSESLAARHRAFEASERSEASRFQCHDSARVARGA